MKDREGVRIEMTFCEETILLEIAEKKATRDDIALSYAFCLNSSENPSFAKINRAIIDRWSRAALRYIKRKAWKLVEEKDK